jgi:hypothetical protein
LNIHYSILFTIDILHEYCRNGRCDDFDVVPSEDTQRLFRGMNLLWRNSGGRYFALINEGVTSGRTYYFSNLAANKRSGTAFLSKPITKIAAGTSYIPGDMVMGPSTDKVFEAVTKHTSTGAAQLSDTSKWQRKGLAFLAKELPVFTAGKVYSQGDWVMGRDSGGNKTDDVYEALKKTTAENVTQLADTSIWKSRGKGDLQYPTAADQVDYSTGSYVFNLPVAVPHAEISFFGFNYDAAAPAFNVPVGQTTVQVFSEPQSKVAVDLSALKPGRYSVNVNGETKTVYYDPALRQANVFGVLEIFNHLPGSNDYSFLTDDEDIRQAGYVLHFPARRVLWKYRRKDSRAVAIEDKREPAVYHFARQGDDFVSTRPILLSQEVIDTLELSFSNGDVKLFPLPNPPVYHLGRINQNGYDYFSTELFLNY